MSNSEERLIKYLSDNGPTQIRELRDITIKPPRRYEGVNDFKINPGRSSGSSVSSGGDSLRIAYLEEEHEPDEIIQVWYEHHRYMVENTPADSIYRATPDVFKDAIRKVVDVDSYYSGRGGHTADYGGECPVCGDEYEGQLPKHLRKDCDGN